MNLPSAYPLYDFGSNELLDGMVTSACGFCRKAIRERKECTEHYARISHEPPGYFECPFGFTTRTFYSHGSLIGFTGVVAHPRFGSDKEREMAKRNPDNKCTRTELDAFAAFFGELDRLRASIAAQQSKVLPQAFHELRKLNGAILQTAEKEMRGLNGETRALKNIRSAAELMRNNFDVLEALANIDAMKAMPMDSTVNVFDLTYKTRCIYEERANTRNIRIVMHDGARAIIRGSQKSFPIVPAVLIENAVKYSIPGTQIDLHVFARNEKAELTVTNRTAGFIDPNTCFVRGTRFSTTVEGGGFGLFLAKQIVEAHSGTITCSAQNGVVEMSVTLPLLEIHR